MSLYLPRKGEFTVESWNAFTQWVINRPNATQFFQATQLKTSGIIIARWSEIDQVPGEYLADAVQPNRADHWTIQAQRFVWQRFGGETVSEDPKQYKNLTVAMKVLETARSVFKEAPEGNRIGLIYWVNPGSRFSPPAAEWRRIEEDQA